MRNYAITLVLLYVASILAVVSSCTTTPKGPEQTVYAAHGSYAAGLSIALQYKRLPVCSATSGPLCKSPAKLGEMQRADDKAFKALTDAQAIVRLGDGPKAEAAATAAQKAIAEFRKQTETVKVK